MPTAHVCDAQHATMTAHPRYRGRFAPTPSGPLHLGSLLTALASWLFARSAGGEWLLRIDDLDRQRCKTEHRDRILQQLELHGLDWDGAIYLQSQHLSEYAAALDRLRLAGRVYACDCTRARLRAIADGADDEPLYDGHCRQRKLDWTDCALRMRVDARELRFDDAGLGPQRCLFENGVGDFVLRRRDGVTGYQLACAVDEQLMGITEVVRGADLLGSTFRQLQVIDALDWPRPAYRHLPVLVDKRGQKLSKQNHAPPIMEDAAAQNLWHCLRWLGQKPPTELLRAPAHELTAWALAHWDPERLALAACIEVEQYP
jgi:glutamyl-Q tRNA(Asp) synthetase